MSGTSGLFDGYPGSAADEVVAADGTMHPSYAPALPALAELGAAGLAAVVAEFSRERRARGLIVGAVDSGARATPLPLDPLPRVVPAADWGRLGRGVEQRTRALNAFLADAYRPVGRRRGDTREDRPEIVRAGIVPEWLITRSPSYRPVAASLAGPDQPRVTVAAVDLMRGHDEWVVLADQLREPAGLGYAIANRDSSRSALPQLFAEVPALPEPHEAVPLLRAALAEAAPPGCAGTPQIALLSDGPTNPAFFEHRLLAEAMGVPFATPETLWSTSTGGIAVEVDGARVPVDVLYRRLDGDALAGHLNPHGVPLAILLGEAVRAGRLALANVPGNGVADDGVAYRHVPEMIRFYLGEEPLLASARTWALADAADHAAVRDRLHELVVTDVDGYGGHGVVFGPTASVADLAQLHAEVEAAPHRFLAQEPVECSTMPTLVDGVVVPRQVGLRMFAVAGSATRALPAPLTEVALREGTHPIATGHGGASKDTWLLP